MQGESPIIWMDRGRTMLGGCSEEGEGDEYVWTHLVGVGANELMNE